MRWKPASARTSASARSPLASRRKGPRQRSYTRPPSASSREPGPRGEYQRQPVLERAPREARMVGAALRRRRERTVPQQHGARQEEPRGRGPERLERQHPAQVPGVEDGREEEHRESTMTKEFRNEPLTDFTKEENAA